MVKSLIYLKKALNSVQDLHILSEISDQWEFGLSIYTWPDRGISETLHNMTNCIIYFDKKQEALIYAVQSSLWAASCIEKLKQTLVFRRKILKSEDENKFY